MNFPESSERYFTLLSYVQKFSVKNFHRNLFKLHTLDSHRRCLHFMNFKLTHFVYKGKEAKSAKQLENLNRMAIIIPSWDLSGSARCLNTRFKSIKNNFLERNGAIIVKWEPISGQSCIQLIVRNVDSFFCSPLSISLLTSNLNYFPPSARSFLYCDLMSCGLEVLKY